MKRWIVLLLLAVACTNERPLPAVSSTEDQNKPQEGGTVIRRLPGDVATLNPIMAQSIHDRYVDFYLFTPMLHFDADLNVTAFVVQEAKGYSRQKGYLDRYAGSEYGLAFLPKVEISVWVSDDRADAVADTIVRAARTGRIGDGKVFIVSGGWPEPLEF